MPGRLVGNGASTSGEPEGRVRDPSLPSRIDHIARAIVVLRGQKVLLDAELAALYGVSTARLNQQVRRNRQRFPGDFAFEVSLAEYSRLMLQIATSNPRRGGRRKPPLAFTEYGALMAATVLNSRAAVEMSIYVVRAFGRLRQLLASNTRLAKRLDELEARINKRIGAQDNVIEEILGALRELTTLPSKRQRRIGFTAPLDDAD